MPVAVSWNYGMEPKANGRALPPRPTLLVGAAGDVEACRTSWAQLEPLAEEILRRAAAGCASAEELDGLVRRFRSLRESLVAAYVKDELAVRIYEASADVCLAAGCWPEYLKSVSGLTGHLYPAQGCALERQQATQRPQRATQGQPQQQPATAHKGEGSEGGAGLEQQAQETPGVSESGSKIGASGVVVVVVGGGGGRQGEMYAAHCLFLAAMPSGRVGDAMALLRSPHALPYLSQEHVQYAIKVLAAMSAGDWHSWLRLRSAAPAASLRAVLDIRASQVRTAALRCMSIAFRALPAPAAVAMLRLPDGESQAHPATRCSCGASQHDSGGSSCATGAEVVGGNAAACKPLVQGSTAWAALRAALEAASAAGIKGAQTAFDGLSAWAAGEGALSDLVFRS